MVCILCYIVFIRFYMVFICFFIYFSMILLVGWIPPPGMTYFCKLERLIPTLGVYVIGLVGLEFSVDERTIGTGSVMFKRV